ncbi:MAG TPA: glycosyltransferase family A protein [Ktedonobacterales bacterium]|nr:glycosyltransferase family A protein [Ktedonobacterales bacterium]
MNGNVPHSISVNIPTRNRPAHAAECVATVLATSGFDELIVIDQSDGTATEEALAAIHDPRFRYVRTPTRGVTIARNLAIELSKGTIVACTDDDCRVAPDWATRIADLFEADPDIAVICGRVRVPEALQGSGFTLGFDPQVREWKGRYPSLGDEWGITANMAIRRDVLARVGGFDPMLGAGAPLRSGGEPDFIFRVIRAGMKVLNAREVVVDHLGVRTDGEEAQKLILGYGAGTAAAIYKHVRLGDPAAIRVYLEFLWSTMYRVGVNVVRGKRPIGLGYLLAFMSGSARSYRFRVDRRLRQYVNR